MCITIQKDFEIISQTNNFETSILLNLETYLICKKSRLETVNFDLLLDNKFHKDTLETSLNFSKLIKFNSKLNFSFKYEIISFLRHRLFTVYFFNRSFREQKNFTILRYYCIWC